jgi:hypothetical protein
LLNNRAELQRAQLEKIRDLMNEHVPGSVVTGFINSFMDINTDAVIEAAGYRLAYEVIDNEVVIYVLMAPDFSASNFDFQL